MATSWMSSVPDPLAFVEVNLSSRPLPTHWNKPLAPIPRAEAPLVPCMTAPPTSTVTPVSLALLTERLPQVAAGLNKKVSMPETLI